jgi:hypothetical protein
MEEITNHNNDNSNSFNKNRGAKVRRYGSFGYTVLRKKTVTYQQGNLLLTALSLMLFCQLIDQ